LNSRVYYVFKGNYSLKFSCQKAGRLKNMETLFTERKALKEYMDWIKEERRRLTDEYWKALNELKNLDEKLEKSLDGPSDTIDRLLNLTESQKESVDNLSKLIPSIPVEVAIDHWKEMNDTHVSDEPVNEFFTNRQVEEEKEKDEKTQPVKIKKRTDVRTLAFEVANYLKEQGVPVKMGKICEFMETKAHKIHNPTSMMVQVMNYEPRIERAKKGFYQYK